MVIWPSLVLDELAGRSNDARPACPQCRGDPSFLAVVAADVAVL